MAHVECSIVRWLNDEPQLGLVEAELVDAAGVAWRFVDKSAIFSAEPLTSRTGFPRPGVIRCEIVDSWAQDDPGTVRITTERPDGVHARDRSTALRLGRRCEVAVLARTSGAEAPLSGAEPDSPALLGGKRGKIRRWRLGSARRSLGAGHRRRARGLVEPFTSRGRGDRRTVSGSATMRL